MEKIILVDIFDRQIGTAEKFQAHHTPMLHRAFSIFVCHNGKMLIQKRAENKYHSGGLWANACCSHPRENERMENALTRRLYEEIGIRNVDVKELFSFVYFHKFHDSLYEYEYDHVFLVDYGGEVIPNPDEIAEIRWIAFDELAMLMRVAPEQFSAWFLISAPRVLSFQI